MAGSGLGGKYALIGMAESDVGIVPDKSPGNFAFRSRWMPCATRV